MFDAALYFAAFLVLMIFALYLMNVEYRFLIAPLFGLVGVYTLKILSSDEDEKHGAEFASVFLGHGRSLLLFIDLLALSLWLIVPASVTLYFANWTDFSPLTMLRGIFLILYAAFFPGFMLTKLLDASGKLSRFELAVAGYIASVFLASTAAYIIYTMHYSLDAYLFPVLWGISTALMGVEIYRLRRRNQIIARPPSFPSRQTAILLAAISGLLITSIVAVNISWYTLIAGDLWTHAAQTAYFLQGDSYVLYPWAYHFFVGAAHSMGGLPIINTMQVLQLLAIMPVLALYVTVKAFVGSRESKTPIISALFFALFMGLGWVTYLYVRSIVLPGDVGSLYGLEFGVSERTYDILAGIYTFRLSLVPTNVAFCALIYGLRLLRGFSQPRLYVAALSFLLTALMLQAHIFEAGFFTATIAVSSIFLWSQDHNQTLGLVEVGSGLGFVWVYLTDYFSPLSQRIFFGSPAGDIYLSGYMYALYALLAAAFIYVTKTLAFKMWPTSTDPLRVLYARIEPRIQRLEGRAIVISLIMCALLGILFGIYTITGPEFFAWQTAGTGDVPWNYYPIRIGIVTSFAVLGAVILLFNEQSLHRLFKFLALGAVAIVIGRVVYLFPLRPGGFGENRVMDILWISASVLAGYGAVQLSHRFYNAARHDAKKMKLLAAAVIVLVLILGTSSFIVYVDSSVTNSMQPGEIPTSTDMAVINYIIQHRNSVGSSLTAPTFETQYIIRKLTLNNPYGYSTPFTTPNLFSQRTIAALLSQVSFSSLQVFLRSYDIAFLEQQGYLPALWYLSYQPTLVNEGTSFLIAPRSLGQPILGGTLGIAYAKNTTLDDFYLISAFGLSNSPYTLRSLDSIFQFIGATTVLLSDTSNTTFYQTALEWVQTPGRTLYVISGIPSQGLFETDLFRNSDGNSTFAATNVNGTTRGNILNSLPAPVTVHARIAVNSTVIAHYAGGGNTSPLAYRKSVGAGSVVLIMARDFYQALHGDMFQETGERFYEFLPLLFQTCGVPVNP